MYKMNINVKFDSNPKTFEEGRLFWALAPSYPDHLLIVTCTSVQAMLWKVHFNYMSFVLVSYVYTSFYTFYTSIKNSLYTFRANPTHVKAA